MSWSLKHWSPVLAGALVLAPLVVSAQERPAAPKTTVLVARVADRATLEPLANAVLAVTDIKRSGRTAEGGVLKLTDISRGMHYVSVRMFGYRESESQLFFNDDTLTTVILLDRVEQ